MTRPRVLLPAALIGLVVLLLIAPPAGAIIPVPQSREEFVSIIAGGRAGKMETFTVDRGLDEVYRTFESLTTPCLDKKIERTANVGYVEHSSSDYNPTLKRMGHDRAEFSLQVVHFPLGTREKTPPGGMYVMAADLKRAGARTEVVIYRPTIGYKNISESLTEWAEGGSTDCPKLR